MTDERKTKKQLLAELERERERSDALYQVSNRLAGAHDTDDVLDPIVNESVRLVGAQGAFIFLLENDAMVPSAATDSVANMIAQTTQANPTYSVNERTGLVGHVMASKQTLVTEDNTQSKFATPDGRRLAQKYDFDGVAAVPLLANDRSVGVLIVVDKRVRRFTDNEEFPPDRLRRPGVVGLGKGPALERSGAGKGTRRDRERTLGRPIPSVQAAGWRTRHG